MLNKVNKYIAKTGHCFDATNVTILIIEIVTVKTL